MSSDVGYQRNDASKAEFSAERKSRYRIFIFFITFLCYTAYHLSRKPLSVVKNVLVTNCSTDHQLNPDAESNDYWCNWPPFNVPKANELLGLLDSSFLFSYAIAMYFSGSIAERVNLRYFLSLGMIASGIGVYLFGIAYSYKIHFVWYYFCVQIFGGIVQTTGWPSVVTLLSNWFGRGFIFGIWNAHTSVGNILGSLIAGAFVSSNWGYSFTIPGLIMGLMGFIVFLFVVVDPEDVGCPNPNHHEQDTSLLRKDNPTVSSFHLHSNKQMCKFLSSKRNKLSEEEKPILMQEKEISQSNNNNKPVKFCDALKIPGVAEFSICLFFAKLVSYTFLYWLPKYISISTSFTAQEAAVLSTVFDTGGIVGGIIAGLISDHSGANACTCMCMLFTAIPMLFLYETFGYTTLATNICLLLVCGALVNGPYALITTAVSAELGTHKSLTGNSKALATVAAIIDGTGSVGAAVGPLLAGVISTAGWQNVFVMLMVSNIFAILSLTRLAVKEVLAFRA
uniref:Sugar phosphate exchanger 3 n=1 Tax=Strigamia maritima TaxID=126957 RepID=T1ITN0_STRMM